MSEGFILLVEDNPDDEELTLRALRKGGITHRVEVVRDGAEAIDFLLGQGRFEQRDPSQTPSVMLLDLQLPKLSGLDVLRRLRANALTRRVPVVVLTSSSEESDIARAYDYGANSYVRKPVEFDKFVEFVRALGTYWLKLNELPGNSRPASI